MCLTACYWARIPRLVFGATSYDVATYGFEDLQLYRELSQPAHQCSRREDTAGEDLRSRATEVLREWAEHLPKPAVPKY
jgi:guanine deaminase